MITSGLTLLNADRMSIFLVDQVRKEFWLVHIPNSPYPEKVLVRSLFVADCPIIRALTMENFW
jgi:hypothetical protein